MQYIKNIFLYSIYNTLRSRPDCLNVCVCVSLCVRVSLLMCESAQNAATYAFFCTHCVCVCVQHLTADATASCNKLYTKRRQSNGKIFARLQCN